MIGLSTLPVDILTHIFTYLLPGEIKYHEGDPVRPTLNQQQTLTQLPETLLPLIEVSPTFALACTHLPGVCMTYLTLRTTNGDLLKWVRALGPLVRGVSTRIDVKEWLDKDIVDEIWRNSAYERLIEESIDLFRLLLKHGRLEVLDLVHVPFHAAKRDELTAALYGVLECNSSTLRELALPAHKHSDPCAMVLEQVTLPRLTVFKIEENGYDTKDRAISFLPCDWGLLQRAVLRLLQAIDGHANRVEGLSTLSELRLVVSTGQLRPISRKVLSVSFFQAIQVFRLSIIRGFAGDLTDFFHPFPRLEKVYLNQLPYMERNIPDKCNNLKEVHICDQTWFDKPTIGVGPVPQFSRIIDPEDKFINVHREKIISFDTGAAMNAETLVRLSLCRKIRNVSIFINYDNVRRLRTLIERCPIEVIQLVVDDFFIKPLEAKEWCLVSDALRVSKSITQCSILENDCALSGTNSGTSMEGLMRCCAMAVRSLGGRARRLMFRVKLQQVGFLEKFYGITRILDNCRLFAPALEFLQVDFFKPKFKLGNGDHRFKSMGVQKLVISRKELLNRVKGLPKVELGALGKVVDRRESQP